MKKWFAEVWNKTKRDAESLFKGSSVFLFLGLLAMPVSAFLFAVGDYGRVNVLLSFIGGFFTGGVFLILIYGPIALWMFLGTFFINLSSTPNSWERGNKPVLIIAMITAFVIVAVTWWGTFKVVTQIPIVGDQVKFMFRHADEDED
jgi:hypothetical protein